MATTVPKRELYSFLCVHSAYCLPAKPRVQALGGRHFLPSAVRKTATYRTLRFFKVAALVPSAGPFTTSRLSECPRIRVRIGVRPRT